MRTRFRYAAYGLSIHSDLPLPDLVAGRAEMDVTLSLGNLDRVPREADTPGVRIHATAEEASLFWKDVGAFSVRDGREIVVDPVPEVEEESVLRSVLLGPILATLLHQRGLLILHASAAWMDGGAVVFLGHSGCGKSTLLAALHARGFEVIADDVTAVRLAAGGPRVLPGIARLKLHPDAAQALGYDPEQLPRVHPAFDKRVVRAAGAQKAAPLTQVYVLAEGAENAIEPVRAQEAVVELVRHSYCSRLLAATGAACHLRQCATLTERNPVRRLRRPRDLSALVRQVDAVVRDIQHGHPRARSVSTGRRTLGSDP